MRKSIAAVVFLSLLFAINASSFAVQASGSELSQQDSPDSVSANDVASIRQRIPADQEAIAAEVEAILKRVETNLKAAESFKQEAAANNQSISQVEQQVKEFTDSTPAQALTQADIKDLPLVDLQRLVTEQTTKVAELKKSADQAAAAIGQRISRRQQIRETLISADRRIADIRAKLNAVDISTGLLAEATRLELISQIQSIELETAALQSQLNRFDAEDRFDLPRLKSEFYKRQSNAAQANLDLLQKQLNDKRKAEAVDKERETRQSQLGSDPLLKFSFDTNLELAKENKAITERISQTEQDLADRTANLDKLRKQFDDANFRVKQIGLSESVGAMLRNQKDLLPNELLIAIHLQDNKTKLEDVQFQLLDVEQQLKDLDEEVIIEEIKKSPEAASASADELADSITELTRQRRELFAAQLKNYQKHFDKLFELDATERPMADLIRDYRGFINERILWIRSNDVLFSFSTDELGKREKLIEREREMEVLQPARWINLGRHLIADFKDHLLIYIVAAVLLLGLLFFKPQMRLAVDKFGIEAARGSCSSFWPTCKSLVISSSIAVVLPGIVLFLGWRIWQISKLPELDVDTGNLGAALAWSLMATSWFAIPMELLRRFCRRAGLAHMHFDWSDETVTTLKQHIDWASPMGSLFVFGVSFFYLLETRHQSDLVERVLFIGGMILLGVILYRCLSPRIGMFRTYLRQNEKSWATQLSFVWFGLLMLVPITLALLTIVGYYYTSLNLAVCVYSTFVFGLIVESFRALMARFILVRRRHAHIELTRRRRRLQRRELPEKIADDKGELAAAFSQSTVTDSELLQDFDVDENAAQSRHLIGMSLLLVWILGLWLIWIDVLPALKALDSYPVWPPNVSLTSSENSASVTAKPNGDAAVAPPSMTGSMTSTNPASTGDKPTRITIRDLLIFFVISIVTLIVARNLPSLIEMTFLNHMPVEPSVRYAFRTIFRYVILLLGMVLAFRSVQIGWSQVQWLATALTFGLAFGLQEIFANFVAGIIVLFERPIRIGDVVTVDDVTGVVTRIRTRATTISNWDRKEYVIPNKEFITGRVLNWTLSDQVNRIVIEVGIAYGSNVEAAKNILYDICKNHPKIINEPPTNIVFERFADSSLILTVRTFVPDVNCRLTVIDQLHAAINDAFNESGIEIAFPQRDLHIRSVDHSVSNAITHQPVSIGSVGS